MPIETGEGRKVSINVINFLMSVVAYCSYLQMFDEIKRAMSEHSNKTAAFHLRYISRRRTTRWNANIKVLRAAFVAAE